MTLEEEGSRCPAAGCHYVSVREHHRLGNPRGPRREAEERHIFRRWTRLLPRLTQLLERPPLLERPLRRLDLRGSMSR